MPEPMYRQIAEDLRHQIEAGELGGDARLPTEVELQRQYGVSRNTARDAVKWLISRGLAETRPGSGTFVLTRADPVIASLNAETGYGGHDFLRYASEAGARTRQPTTSPPRVEIQQASAAVARDLRLQEGTAVVSRRQRRFIDGRPWSLQTTFYPMRYVDAGAKRLLEAADIPEGAVSYLAETLGIEQAGWRDLITVRPPDNEETAFFKVADDGRVSVFDLHRLSFELSGRPLRVTTTVYRADCNQFLMTVGNVAVDAGASSPTDLVDSSPAPDSQLGHGREYPDLSACPLASRSSDDPQAYKLKSGINAEPNAWARACTWRRHRALAARAGSCERHIAG